ncbi:hypothetical protein [Methylobrevis albus]|uniref:Uncharacterized protein n=1 Tax=Methylobrevis albus TaxID=2793297 RepID=A0A931I0H4_9HYPH|nr:hypothetical protein [Methylobrevis albus]MBH0238082.1 hypothetical protein [Methylobrevis albus]
MAPQPKVKLSKLRDIGWSLWDPIGMLRGAGPGAWQREENERFANEYDRYLVGAASSLRRGVPAAEVVAELVEIEASYMGLGERPDTRARAVAVVAAILADPTIWTWPDEQGRFS